MLIDNATDLSAAICSITDHKSFKVLNKKGLRLQLFANCVKVTKTTNYFNAPDKLAAELHFSL